MDNEGKSGRFEHYIALLEDALLAETDESRSREVVRVLKQVLTQRKRLREAAARGETIRATFDVCALTLLDSLEPESSEVKVND